MTKIGIINCGNLKNDLSCSSVLCFKDLYEGSGTFKQYDGDVQLVGMVACAGCPTAVGHEKILDKVNALVGFGAEKIHFASCINAICPFKAKFEKVINEHYPDVEIVKGTHGEIESETFKQEDVMFRGMVKSLLGTRRPNITDAAKELENKN